MNFNSDYEAVAMYFCLDGSKVRITIQGQNILHLTEDTTETRRILVSTLTKNLKQHQWLMDGLGRARQSGGILVDMAGNPLGIWRVTDLPVSYRMDEDDQERKVLFELEEMQN